MCHSDSGQVSEAPSSPAIGIREEANHWVRKDMILEHCGKGTWAWFKAWVISLGHDNQ